MLLILAIGGLVILPQHSEHRDDSKPDDSWRTLVRSKLFWGNSMFYGVHLMHMSFFFASLDARLTALGHNYIGHDYMGHYVRHN